VIVSLLYKLPGDVNFSSHFQHITDGVLELQGAQSGSLWKGR